MKKLISLFGIFISIGAVSQSTSYERDSVAQTPAFQVKVKMAAHKAAGDILSDTLSLERVRQYAQIIVSEPNGSWLTALSYQVMTNPVIGAGSPDNDIEFVVNSVFYKTAFAFYKEEQPTPYLQKLLKRVKEKQRKKSDEEKEAEGQATLEAAQLEKIEANLKLTKSQKAALKQ